jgi:hypothetical protein
MKKPLSLILAVLLFLLLSCSKEGNDSPSAPLTRSYTLVRSPFVSPVSSAGAFWRHPGSRV